MVGANSRTAAKAGNEMKIERNELKDESARNGRVKREPVGKDEREWGKGGRGKEKLGHSTQWGKCIRV